MTTDKTIRVSLRLKTDVHSVLVKIAQAKGVEPATYMQDLLEEAVFDELPQERQQELSDTKRLFEIAQELARHLYDEGVFDEHFTLTVFRKLMTHPEGRRLYEKLIGTSAINETTPKKTPLNMYLGWFIKNAVGAQPQVDDNEKPVRAFVRNEPIKSYTLLKMPY